MGSHLWYSSSLFSNGTLKQFDEDRQFSLLDLSESSLHPDADMPYAYKYLTLKIFPTNLESLGNPPKTYPSPSVPPLLDSYGTSNISLWKSC